MAAPRPRPGDLRLREMPADYAGWYGSMLDKASDTVGALQRLVASNLPAINTRLVRTLSIGADVRPVGGGYEVRIHAALPAILHFALNSLLRTPQFM